MPDPAHPHNVPSDVVRPDFVLLQRDDCHLCDLALEVLAQAGLPEFDSVFIDDDTGMEAAYGHRVPVLRREADHAEIDWPFDADAVRRLIEP